MSDEKSYSKWTWNESDGHFFCYLRVESVCNMNYWKWTSTGLAVDFIYKDCFLIVIQNINDLIDSTGLLIGEMNENRTKIELFQQFSDVS